MYQVTITHIEKVTEKKREYQRIADGEDGTGVYGYTDPIDVTVEKKEQVYGQLVEALDVSAVIEAVNAT